MVVRQPVLVSVVSNGATVIKVSRNIFEDLLDNKTMLKIEKQCNIQKYPPDEVLCRRYLQYNEWKNYRREIVEDVLTKHQVFLQAFNIRATHDKAKITSFKSVSI